MKKGDKRDENQKFSNFPKDSKGLSTIIVTVILIGLSLVAIVIVWTVVSNLLKSGTQQASFQFGTMFLNLKIEKATIDSGIGNVSVTVNRGTGQGDMTGIAFVISDGTNTKVIKKIATINELDTQTFTFTSSDLGNLNLSLIKEIDIAPIVGDQVGSKVDTTKIFSTSQIPGNGSQVNNTQINNTQVNNTQVNNTQNGTIFLNLKIQNVVVNPSAGSISVTVYRGTGQGTLTGIAFVISDGTNTKAINETTSMNELQNQTFTFSPTDLGNISFIREIDIASIVGGQVGSQVDNQTFSTTQILQNLGAVSWWKLNGNTNDQIGGNNGNIIGNVSFVQGKFGQAGSFNGGSNYIRLSTPTNLPLGNSPRTMLAWINPSGYNDSTYNGIVAYGTMNCTSVGSVFSIKNNSMLSQAFWCNDGTQTSGNSVTLNSWNFVAFTYSSGSTNVSFYINGNFVQQTSLSAGVPAATTSGPLRIGCTDDPGRCFKGQIQDVMIFNQSLTSQQIQSLYQLNLSS